MEELKLPSIGNARQLKVALEFKFNEWSSRMDRTRGVLDEIYLALEKYLLSKYNLAITQQIKCQK